ncbi:hypothetical protein WME90_45310 [Sorangium sp. So ce375]|uniref:hypothetical protein n=1 Tax=Sorangium sp. So ce375 TaxID=3133306 RepID=UPI003F5C15F3
MGSDNITVTNTTGNVDIHVGDTHTVYNNQYGLSAEDIRKIVQEALPKQGDLALSEFKKIVLPKLDDLGVVRRSMDAQRLELARIRRDLQKLSAAVTKDQAQHLRTIENSVASLQAQQTRLESQLQGFGSDITKELREGLSGLSSGVATVISSIQEARKQDESRRESRERAERAELERRKRAERAELIRPKKSLEFGPACDTRGLRLRVSETRCGFDISASWEALRFGDDVALGPFAGLALATIPDDTHYVDPSGTSLSTSEHRGVFWALQGGMYLRLLRTSRVSIATWLGARRTWRESEEGPTGRKTAFWAFPLYFGPEVRAGAVSLGANLLVVVDTTPNRTTFEYSGVGSDLRQLDDETNLFGGLRVYAKLSF